MKGAAPLHLHMDHMRAEDHDNNTHHSPATTSHPRILGEKNGLHTVIMTLRTCSSRRWPSSNRVLNPSLCREAESCGAVAAVSKITLR
jgi:hypothetical protein